MRRPDLRHRHLKATAECVDTLGALFDSLAQCRDLWHAWIARVEDMHVWRRDRRRHGRQHKRAARARATGTPAMRCVAAVAAVRASRAARAVGFAARVAKSSARLQQAMRVCVLSDGQTNEAAALCLGLDTR